MILFVKKNCEKCEFVKGKLPEDLKLKMMDVETPEGMAELAFYQLIQKAEQILPILIEDEGDNFSPKVHLGAINVMKALNIG